MWIWLIVAIVLITVGIFIVGTLDWDYDEKAATLLIIVLSSALWPLVLTAVAAFGPFYGIYKLGNYAGKKKHAKKP